MIAFCINDNANVNLNLTYQFAHKLNSNEIDLFPISNKIFYSSNALIFKNHSHFEINRNEFCYVRHQFSFKIFEIKYPVIRKCRYIILNICLFNVYTIHGLEYRSLSQKLIEFKNDISFHTIFFASWSCISMPIEMKNIVGENIEIPLQ